MYDGRGDRGDPRRLGRGSVPSNGAPPRTLFAVGPIAAATAGLVLTLLAAWAGAATWYIASREDVVGELLRRHAQTEARYEDHLGALRARLDRVATEKLIDQDTLEQRVAGLVSRQVELETRQAVLADLAQRIAPAVVTTGSLSTLRPEAPEAAAPSPPPSAPASASAFAPVDAAPRPRPEGFSAAPRPHPAPAPLELRLRREADSRADAVFIPLPAPAPVDGDLVGAERSLAGVERRQIETLQRIHSRIEAEAGILRDAIVTAGLDPQALQPADPEVLAAEGIGGPFIPIGIDADAGGFEALVADLQETLVDRDRLRRTTVTIPFARPVDGDIAVTSTFGVRSDPFTRRPAFHAGIDFRARTGEPVYATAAGRVVSAGRAGGYGNLVEIDHGNGLTTRFAHLSAISVSEGDDVTAGASIGRAGSTGRSTGPHLHYETRIDDRPVDPRRFMRAAAVLDELDDLEAVR